ncbi:MAG: hypothetical protein A2W17_12555 [Planctomycetes bacterium RBG_16_41_13]|nr:MAG: hypothetical protein A2W17_12555 [Planctomycetes bacterium RBG_16_41_13]
MSCYNNKWDSPKEEHLDHGHHYCHNCKKHHSTVNTANAECKDCMGAKLSGKDGACHWEDVDGLL